MFVSGLTFCGAKYTLDSTPTNVSNINLVTIKNGIYDDLYISKNTNREYAPTIPTQWDFNTMLYASFENSLNAGNVDYVISEITLIRVKRRVKNTFTWITLFEVPISGESDIHFERFDFYAQSGVEYEYALIPVINGIEGNINVNSVLSEFEGIYIIEKEQAFKTILDVSVQSQKNRPNAVVNTIDRKYPYVISNGKNNYYSGTATGVFIELDYDTCQWKVDEGWKYREGLMEFLQNGQPKILKHEDGRMWLVMIVDNPSESASEHPDKAVTTFNWVETGDCKSSHDLYDNGLIDVDIEGV